MAFIVLIPVVSAGWEGSRVPSREALELNAAHDRWSICIDAHSSNSNCAMESQPAGVRVGRSVPVVAVAAFEPSLAGLCAHSNPAALNIANDSVVLRNGRKFIKTTSFKNSIFPSTAKLYAFAASNLYGLLIS
jgi:hypothetical protein